MSIFAKILGNGAKEVSESVAPLIDKFVTNESEKLQAKHEFSELVLNSQLTVLRTQSDVLKTEMTGSFLQRNWRPITMLVFVSLMVITWMGWGDKSLPESVQIELMQIVKFGLGGYVVGRSVEKTVGTVSKNIDLSLLRKKDRKDHII